MAKSSAKTILSRVLFAGYICAVCLVCFISSENVPELKKTIFGLPADKVVHFIMFAPFAFLTYLSFDHPSRKAGKCVLFAFLTLASGLLIAFATEVVQSYLPTRTMDVKDFYADAIAIAVTTVFVLIIDLTHKK